MLNLDPGKLLIIAVVAVILLGPDRLPAFARQVGGAWRAFTAYRHKMEQEVRSSMPDLPTSSEIARLARSPSALLDRLSALPSDPASVTPSEHAASEEPALLEPSRPAVARREMPVRVPDATSPAPMDPGLN